MVRKTIESAVNMLVEYVGKFVRLDNERYEIKEDRRCILLSTNRRKSKKNLYHVNAK